MLPGDGSGSEEDGVDGGQVVVLGVELEGDGEEGEIGEGDPAHVGDGAGAQEGDEAGDPEEGVEGVHHHELGSEEGEQGELDVFMLELAVVEKFEGGPAMVRLPEEVGESDPDEESDGEGGPAGEEDAALGCEEEANAETDEEEGHRGLVEEAEAGGDAEDRPPLAETGAGEDADESEGREHPEDGFDGVHGEKAVEGEVLGGAEDAEHGEGLGGAAAAERPGEDAGEEDGEGTGEGGEHADAEDGGAEESLGEAGLDGDAGAVVHVSPGEALAADEVVELVAEVAVAEVLGVEGGDDVQGEFEGGEGEGEAQGGGEVVVCRFDDGGSGRGWRA